MTKVLAVSMINPAEMIALMVDGENLPEPEHTHEFIEIEYILSGSGRQVVNGVEYRVCKGDMLFFNVGDRHAYYPDGSMEIANCIFLPALMDKALADVKASPGDAIPPVISFSGNEVLEIEHLIQAMRSEYEAKDTGYLVALRSYLDLLLVKILRRARCKTAQHSQPMLRVLDYIENHYSEISASDVAVFSSYNPSYFSKLFKEHVGINLTEYINNRRINEAIRLIRDTDYPIERISYLVGYRDKKHFYKLFKKATGVTPNTLRETRTPPEAVRRQPDSPPADDA
mgnify:CR=1 FL=1